MTTGIVIAATPQTRTGALALPVEENGWLVAAAGYGDLRPGREVADFEAFLNALPDPALTDLISTLDPIGGVAVHRQTGNRRFSYGRSRDWPVGLLVVGDALCAFNPVYGQGITVAAVQAEILSTELATVNGARSTRRLQRRLAAVADTAWSVATSQDRRMPTSSAHPTTFERLTDRWAARTARLAAAGDEACIRAFARIYHLMGSPLLLFHPRVAVAVLRSLVFGVPPAAPRPPVLETITAVRPGP